MKVCIECGANQTSNNKSFCNKCGNKIDKYTEMSETLCMIDLILLKEPVFKHFIINKQFRIENNILIVLLYILSILSPAINEMHKMSEKYKINKLKIGLGTEIDLGYSKITIQIASIILYILFIKILFNNIKISKIINITIFSSFFMHLRIAFSLWKYSEIQYYILSDILMCLGNICGMSCYESKDKAYAGVILAKVLSSSTAIMLYALFI